MAPQDVFQFAHAAAGKTLAITVGGGPAPGINGVIRAATIQAIKNGLRVLGVMEGFRYLAEGETTHVRELTIDDISRIHYRGGSILKTSRVNPTKSEGAMENVMRALTQLGVDYLITIGGDDTAFTASRIDETAGSRIAVAHVPKTIDNDLPLPGHTVTFGYETARHVGTEIARNIMEDANTSVRWYYLIAMGRKAGHLALGIGQSASTTLTVVPEDFPKTPIRFQHLIDILEGSVIKRRAMGKGYGVAVIAEGLAEIIDPEDLAEFKDVERDAHGNIRFAEIPLGRLLVQSVRKSLKSRKIDVTLVDKNIGYELRCVQPIPFDLEYTQNLGHAATRFLIEGGTGAIVSLHGGQVAPLPFRDILDPKTGKTRVRMVDTQSDTYQIARSFMIKLEKQDLIEPKNRALLAQAANMTEAELVRRFSYLFE